MRIAASALGLLATVALPAGQALAQDPATLGAPGLAYVCEGGDVVRADYANGRAVVSWGDQAWNMGPVAGQLGRYAAQGRQWQVGVTREGETGVLTAPGAKLAVLARCQRSGELSPAAASLPPPGSAHACTAGELSLKLLGEDAGAGQRWDTVAVANRGLTACAVQGFPEVQLLGDDGRPAPGVAVETSLQSGPGAGPAQRIELKPGARAVFYMHWTPIPGGSETCPHVTRLQATVPGGKTGLLPLNATPCDRVTVSPLRADTGAAG